MSNITKDAKSLARSAAPAQALTPNFSGKDCEPVEWLRDRALLI